MSSSGVEDETILDVLRSADAPRLTTTEAADRLPITRGRTRTRLQQLADDGRIERETVGNEVVWWLPEREGEVGSEKGEAATDDGGNEEPDAEGDEELDAEENEEPDAEENEEPDAEESEVQPAVVEIGPETGAETPEDADRSGKRRESAEAERTTGAGDDGPADIEVEPVSDRITTKGSTTDVETPALDNETRTGPLRASIRSPGDRSLRALALLAALVVVFAFLRNYLRGRGGE